jgi:hypothetical protein
LGQILKLILNLFSEVAGADDFGMSVVLEVIAAKHMSLTVSAISEITGICDPDKFVPAELSDILHNAYVAEGKLSKLFPEK